MSKNKKDDNENQMFTDEELIALEKVNLNELKSKKQEIQQIVDNNVQDIIEYDKKDRQRRIKIEQINKKMDKDIILAQREKEELQQQIDNEKLKSQKELDNLKSQKQEKFQQLSSEKETQISQLQQQIEYLKSDLLGYKEDDIEEQNYINEIESLKALENETVDKHMQEIRKLRRNQAKIAYKLDSVAAAKLEDIQKSAFKMAQKQVAHEEHEKVQTNIDLKKQLFSIQDQVKQIKKENETLLEESKQYQIDMKLEKEGIIAYQQYNANQLVQIKKLKKQVEELKQEISQKVTDFHREVEFVKIQDKQRTEELEKEKQIIKEQIKIKQEELKIVKPLALCIIKQKQEVEQFFTEYLYEIKEEIKNQKKQKYFNHSKLSLSLPKNSFLPKKQNNKLSVQSVSLANNNNSQHKLPKINQKAYSQRNNSLQINTIQQNNQNKDNKQILNQSQSQNLKQNQNQSQSKNSNKNQIKQTLDKDDHTQNNQNTNQNNSQNLNQSYNSQNKNNSSFNSQQSNKYNEKLNMSKVDIKDLQLEEKEKLLRVLLVNVNNGKPAENWEELYKQIDNNNNSFNNNNNSLSFQKQNQYNNSNINIQQNQYDDSKFQSPNFLIENQNLNSKEQISVDQ